MRLIVDESAGRAVVEYLRGTEHDILVVAEEMPQADDPVVLARAAAEGRVLVTNDKDFGDLVFRARQPHAGVLLLRLRDETPDSRVRVVRAVLDRWAVRLPGRFTVATEAEVRFFPRDG